MRPYKADSALLIDDEPLYLEWLVDFLKSKKLKVDLAANADEALRHVETAEYRVLIVDLNIPAELALKTTLKRVGPIYDQFPGLYVAKRARSLGTSGGRVVIYSVYQTEALSAEVSKLGCDYIAKGRPRVMKDELNEILKRDPLPKKRAREAARIKGLRDRKKSKQPLITGRKSGSKTKR